MKRRTLLFSLLLCSCVQEVDLGLQKPMPTQNDGGVTMQNDAGTQQDGGTTQDMGTTGCGDGCPPNAVCQNGQCVAVGCEGNPPLCESCGELVPPQCLDGVWFCVDVSCDNCNVDSECGDSQFCDNDFAARVGDCTVCPEVEFPPCAFGFVHGYQYGNGCQLVTCQPRQPNQLTIDPSTLTFFDLPIDSIRYAASGYDPEARTCVTLIWPLDNTNDGHAFCGDSDPYVIITPDTDLPCGQWDYGSEFVTMTAQGCYDFADFGLFHDHEPHQNLVDMFVSVASIDASYDITMKNREASQPRPVSFVFEYGTDTTGEQLWIQDVDELYRPGWIHVLADGALLPMGEGCGVDLCPGGGGTCPRALRQARNIIGPNDFGGRAVLNWDGYVYNMPTAATCHERQPAHPRQYQAEFCFGRNVVVTSGDEEVTNVECHYVDFTYPTDQVVLHIDEGG